MFVNGVADINAARKASLTRQFIRYTSFTGIGRLRLIFRAALEIFGQKQGQGFSLVIFAPLLFRYLPFYTVRQVQDPPYICP